MTDSLVKAPERFIDKANPYTGEPLYRFPCATEASINEAVSNAKSSGEALQASSVKQRVKALKAIARLLLANASELAELVSSEVGKPLSEAYTADLLTSVTQLKAYACWGVNWLKPKRLSTLRDWVLGQSYTQYHVPYGVVAVITPWNYPLGTPTSFLAAALLAGNTVVFKPSELTTYSGLRLAELFQLGLQQAGLPSDALQVLTGDGAVGKQLVQHPEIKHVGFTGSEATGKTILKHCAERHIGCNLELGGSDAALVLPCAAPNLEALASLLTWGRLSNAGQTCAAVKRVVVHESLKDPLTERLKQLWQQLRLGNPPEPSTQPSQHIGPLINEGQQQRYQQQLQKSLSQGDTLLWQADLPEILLEQGYFVAPAIVEVGSPHSVLWQQETFGPVLAIASYSSEQEALNWMKHPVFGLGASVFGSNEKAITLAKQLQVGQVAVNGLGMTHYAAPQVPWTGWAQSGPGVRNGKAGLLAWTKTQVLSHNLMQRLIGKVRKPPYLFKKHPFLKGVKPVPFPLNALSDPTGFKLLWAPSVLRWLLNHLPNSRL